MTQRDIFAELNDGMEAWGEFNAGQKTLRADRASFKPASMTPAEVKAVREKLFLHNICIPASPRCRIGSKGWPDLISRPFYSSKW